MLAMPLEDNDIASAFSIIFDDLNHLGPGDPAITGNLVRRLRPKLPSEPRVADFGCGVGASTLVLARSLPKARVLALDFHAPFVARLENEADAGGVGKCISAVVGDMANPPSLDGVMGEFDLIWSESAIYSIGRSNAFTRWRPLLKPGGWLVFSDVVWQCEPANRSDEGSMWCQPAAGRG
jgi:SAM-dependent methyltransferase